MASISEQLANEVLRIQSARNDLRNKAVEIGIAPSTADIDDLATAFNGVENRGAVSANVREGDTYTIPKGYHNGSGTVSGVAGGGNYSLQSKTITPTKAQQNVTPDSGYYGLSDVTVNAIPEAYQDVSAVTAGAADVLVNKVIVGTNGKAIAGTMPNNGAVSKTLDATTTSYTVPKGYHNGSGTVKITTESKTATPTKSAQDITPSSGKVLSGVTVDPIPDAYQDVTGVTAEAGDVLTGKNIVGSDGTVIAGTMPINESKTTALYFSDANDKHIYTIPAGYHDGTGKVGLNANTERVIPTKSMQVVKTTDPETVLLSVTVGPIPAAYQDVTGVTAEAGDVLTGKTIVTSDGTVTAGTMANKGAVTKTLDTTTASYTIPAGYHNGSGKVSITTETKTATPTKSAQDITPSSGKVLSGVTVDPIPDAYQDVTGVTAAAEDVLTGNIIVGSDGTLIPGRMPNIGVVDKTLDATTTSYTVPKGYHNGSGTVSITTETKTATPTKSAQDITPRGGKVLSKVTVNAIPAAYQDVTSVTAAAGDVLTGKTIVGSDGTVINGSMANNGSVSKTIDPLSQDSVTIPAGYTTGGTVTVTDDLLNALKAI